MAKDRKLRVLEEHQTVLWPKREWAPAARGRGEKEEGEPSRKYFSGDDCISLDTIKTTQLYA